MAQNARLCQRQTTGRGRRRGFDARARRTAPEGGRAPREGGVTTSGAGEMAAFWFETAEATMVLKKTADRLRIATWIFADGIKHNQRQNQT